MYEKIVRKNKMEYISIFMRREDIILLESKIAKSISLKRKILILANDRTA